MDDDGWMMGDGWVDDGWWVMYYEWWMGGWTGGRMMDGWWMGGWTDGRMMDGWWMMDSWMMDKPRVQCHCSQEYSVTAANWRVFWRNGQSVLFCLFSSMSTNWVTGTEQPIPPTGVKALILSLLFFILSSFPLYTWERQSLHKTSSPLLEAPSAPWSTLKKAEKAQRE